MNSGQYHFLISGRCQTLYFLQNILNISASHPSSGIRNNAVTAELVTTILYFYKRAGMLCCMIQCQLLKCLFSWLISTTASTFSPLPAKKASSRSTSSFSDYFRSEYQLLHHILPHPLWSVHSIRQQQQPHPDSAFCPVQHLS